MECRVEQTFVCTIFYDNGNSSVFDDIKRYCIPNEPPELC